MKSKKTKIVLGILAAVVLVGGIAVYLFLRDDAPDAGSKDKALAGAEAPTATAPGGTAREGIEGDWAVVPQAGEFTFDVETGTYAGFRIVEKLQNVGETTAVGRTGDVTGTITIEGSTLTAGTFEVDLTTIETDRSQRNGKVQSALNTQEFPTGTFTLTEPVDLGDGAAEGADVAVTAKGDLTIAGVTKPVELTVEAKLQDGLIGLYAATELTFSDFDVDVPSSPVVLSVADEGTLEIQLVLTPA